MSSNEEVPGRQPEDGQRGIPGSQGATIGPLSSFAIVAECFRLLADKIALAARKDGIRMDSPTGVLIQETQQALYQSADTVDGMSVEFEWLRSTLQAELAQSVSVRREMRQVGAETLVLTRRLKERLAQLEPHHDIKPGRWPSLQFLLGRPITPRWTAAFCITAIILFSGGAFLGHLQGKATMVDAMMERRFSSVSAPTIDVMPGDACCAFRSLMTIP